MERNWHLKFKNNHCIFLKNNTCTVNEVKPVQCKTWPFWPELMEDKKTFEKEVIDFCPGSQEKTKTVPAQEIKKQMKEVEDAFFEV